MLVQLAARLEVVAMHTVSLRDAERLGEFDVVEVGVVRDAARLLV